MTDAQWHKQMEDEQRRLESHRPMLEYLRSVWRQKSYYERVLERDAKKRKKLF